MPDPSRRQHPEAVDTASHGGYSNAAPLVLVEREVLSGALRKISSASHAGYSNAEVLALWAFLQERLSSNLDPARESALRVRVEQLLLRFPPPEIPPSSAERRTNLALRVALDRSRQDKPITIAEQHLIRATLDGLKTLNAPEANQQRLIDVIERLCKPVAASPMNAVTTAEDFFHKAVLTRVDDLFGVPVQINVRVVEHSGNLIVTQELPEGHLLRVQGNVTLERVVVGHVMATGNVTASENILGGYIVSESGNCELGKCLSGTKVIALAGNATLASVESADLVCVAGALHVSGNLRARKVIAGSMDVTGTISDSECHVFSGVRAARIEASAKGKTLIYFRSLATPQDFGGSLSDSEANLLRNLLRVHTRREIANAQMHILDQDLQYLYQAIIYALRAPAEADPSPLKLREAQFQMIQFALLSELSAACAAALLRAAEAPEDWMRVCAGGSLDECGAAAKSIEKEIEQTPDDYAKQSKVALLAAWKQYGNLLKKIRDSIQGSSGADAYLDQLAARADEWRQASGEAAAKLRDWRENINAVLRESAGQQQQDTLAQACNVALLKAGPRPTSGPLAALHSSLDKLNLNAERFKSVSSAASAEADALRVQFGGLLFLPLQKRQHQATADSWSRHVQLAPTLPVQSLLKKHLFVLEDVPPARETFLVDLHHVQRKLQ